MKLVEKIQIIDRKVIADSRGYFLKVLTGKEDFLPNHTGEIYLTSAKPREAKGGHYHHKANEWFTLLQGECRLELFDTVTHEEFAIILNASTPQTIFIPCSIAHVFINISQDSDFLLLAYTDQYFCPTDTVAFKFKSL